MYIYIYINNSSYTVTGPEVRSVVRKTSLHKPIDVFLFMTLSDADLASDWLRADRHLLRMLIGLRLKSLRQRDI